MRRQLLCFALLLVLAPQAVPAPPPSANVSLISIVLEKKLGDQVQTVDPTHVFNGGDTVRFRLRPAVDGFLYVMDLNTSGNYEVLFPRPETGNDNRIARGHDYIMPATSNGWFQISGPAGRETIYFVLSPIQLTIGQIQNRATANLPPQGTAPTTMQPRCDDAIFKARGECVDSGAGPKTVGPDEPLPREITQAAPNNGASRDLKFTSDGASATVTSDSPLAGPVVYEFLLAHN
ncbi:MAG: DUF4384 domain-containing protein [Terracidiphilus sp.]